MSACTGAGCPVCAGEARKVMDARAAIEKAKAWTEGFMFAYYMERGWDVPEALEKARSASPDHLTQLVPGWNPYDPSPRLDDDEDVD